MAATQRFLQYIAPSGKNKLPTVHLRCHVTPGAAKVREGVTSLTEDSVKLCVAAAARDGESNKAVLAVLSKVSKMHFYVLVDCFVMNLVILPTTLMEKKILMGSWVDNKTFTRPSIFQSLIYISPAVASLGTKLLQ